MDPNDLAAQDRRRGFQRIEDINFDLAFEYDYSPVPKDFIGEVKYPLRNQVKNFQPTFPLGRPGVPLTEEEKKKLRIPDGKPGVLPDKVVRDVFQKPNYSTFDRIRQYEKAVGSLPQPEQQKLLTPSFLEEQKAHYRNIPIPGLCDLPRLHLAERERQKHGERPRFVRRYRGICLS